MRFASWPSFSDLGLDTFVRQISNARRADVTAFNDVERRLSRTEKITVLKDTAPESIYIQSPDGTVWEITIDNSGVLATATA